MPDIAHPLVATPFIVGDTLDPTRVADGLYDPKATPDNMAVINGRLDEDNLKAPYSITYDVVRPGAMATGKSVGQTTNLDFYSDWFLGDYDADVYSEAMDRAITGVGIKFYVPYACTVVKLSWHVGVIVDGGHVRTDTPSLVEDIDHLSDSAPNTGSGNTYLTGTNPGDNTLLTLFLEGVEQQQYSRRIRTGKSSMCGSTYYKTGAPVGLRALEGSGYGGGINRKYWNQVVTPDHRWWSGHMHVASGALISKGWHTASIRVTNGKWDMATTTQADGATPLRKVAPHVRFKTCHFTAIPIR